MLWTKFEENTRLLNRIDYKEKSYRHSSYLTEHESQIINFADDSDVHDDELTKGCEVVADVMRELFNQQGFQHYLEEELFWLYRLKRLFGEWVNSIELPHNLRYSIPQNVLYLSFYYTGLLENTYKIAPKNILHIHGTTDSKIEIKESISSDTHWLTSYYCEDDKLRAKELIVNKLGIDKLEIKKLDNILRNV